MLQIPELQKPPGLILQIQILNQITYKFFKSIAVLNAYTPNTHC